MLNLINSVKRKINSLIIDKNAKISYSQCGEDLIVQFILHELRKTDISYLDIGAHHPTYINNTALFYKNGSTGVSVEPDPFLYQHINNKRPNDVNLNVGIGGDVVSEADFYILSEKTLNTFSKTEAERCVSYGNKKIEQIVKLPLIPVNDILEKHFDSYGPDFISLDVEGYDMVILKSFNFEKYRPKVWCIETITYTEDRTEKKIQETIDFMMSKNYFVYADTYINTIFVDKAAWLNRK